MGSSGAWDAEHRIVLDDLVSTLEYELHAAEVSEVSAEVRSAIEHDFAHQKGLMGLMVAGAFLRIFAQPSRRIPARASSQLCWHHAGGRLCRFHDFY